VAAVSALSSSIAALIAPHDPGWQHFEKHAATLFSIAAIAAFGSATLRQWQAEARAIAQTAQSHQKTRDSKADEAGVHEVSALEEREASQREIACQAEKLRIAQLRLERAIGATQDALFEFDVARGTLWHSRRLLDMLGDPADAADLTIESFR